MHPLAKVLVGFTILIMVWWGLFSLLGWANEVQDTNDAIEAANRAVEMAQDELEEAEARAADAEAQLESAEDRLKELEAENERLSTMVVSLETGKNTIEEMTTESAKGFIERVFYQDGALYIARDPEWVWYTDTALETRAKGTTCLISPVTLRVDLQNGLQVYAALGEDGFVFSHEKPRIVEDKEG